MTSDKTALGRALNDQLRQRGIGGRINVTTGVLDRGPVFLACAVALMAQTTDFSEDNDPYGEHDFGSLELGDTRMFWKIDYYDPTLTAGAEDPSDPETCTRVLTIMLAEEY